MVFCNALTVVVSFTSDDFTFATPAASPFRSVLYSFAATRAESAAFAHAALAALNSWLFHAAYPPNPPPANTSTATAAIAGISHFGRGFTVAAWTMPVSAGIPMDAPSGNGTGGATPVRPAFTPSGIGGTDPARPASPSGTGTGVIACLFFPSSIMSHPSCLV